MKRVHPNSSVANTPCSTSSNSCSDTKLPVASMVEFTVWRKSLLFNCRGFTVFNGDGNLAYRVDSYSSGSGGEIVLMDTAGKPLLTSRRKKLSLSFGEQWQVYDGEATAKPQFAMKKHNSLRQPKTLAHVKPCKASEHCMYEIEGSYAQRSCVVYGERRQMLAEIKTKESAASGVSFGADVYKLVVYPGIDTTLAMAIVVLLDQIFG